jgi:preprotein translocase SecE subunit
MSLQKYLKETRYELTQTVWPTKKTVVSMAIAVILVSIIVAYILGGFDVLFKIILAKILSFKAN